MEDRGCCNADLPPFPPPERLSGCVSVRLLLRAVSIHAGCGFHVHDIIG